MKFMAMLKKSIYYLMAISVVFSLLFVACDGGNIVGENKNSNSNNNNEVTDNEHITKHEIAWLDMTKINVPYAKYLRMVKITQGKHAGELLVTYQDRAHGGNFWGIRSKDGGLTWSSPKILLKWNAKWLPDKHDWSMAIANCNIIQLDDGRLMMVHQERGPGIAAYNTGIKVRYSSDGGETWTAKHVNGFNVATRNTGQLALQASGWEPRANSSST